MERTCLLKVHVSADLYISASKTAVFSVLDCIFFPIVDINISWRTFPSPGQKVSQRTLTQSLNFDVYRLCVRSLHVVNDVWIFFTGLLLKESKIWLNIFNLSWLQTEDCDCWLSETVWLEKMLPDNSYDCSRECLSQSWNIEKNKNIVMHRSLQLIVKLIYCALFYCSVRTNKISFM